MNLQKLYGHWKNSVISNPNTLMFLLLQGLFSLIIALLTAAADPLFLNHIPDALEMGLYRYILDGASTEISQINSDMTALLFFAGALLLILGGFFYTGRTDRGEKWKKTTGAFLISLILSVLTQIQLKTAHPLPLAYSFLYLWRFCAGIFYLMIFWDNAGVYFDSRTSKKVFPLFALAGTFSYAAGSLLGASRFMVQNRQWAFVIIGLLSIAGAITSWMIPRKLKAVTAKRYRKQKWVDECIEGIRFFIRHPYLRSLGAATIVFGLTSGVIMFIYNQLVSGSSLPSFSSGRFMALQRAAASTAQTIIFVLMMSQGKTGKGIVKNIITKFFFLLLGILGFLISMLGVADFSRAVATALMSPVTIASFALLPSAYRGRALSLNSMVLASLGLFLSSGLMYFGSLTGWGTPFYLTIILILLISRIAMNLLLSRGYMKGLSSKLSGIQGSNVSDDDLKKALEDPQILEQWLKYMKSSQGDQLLLWSRIAKFAETHDQWIHLKSWAPGEDHPAYVSWLQICGRCAPRESLEVFRQWAELETDRGQEALRQWLGYKDISTEDKEKCFQMLEKSLIEDSHGWPMAAEFFPEETLNHLRMQLPQWTPEQQNQRISALSLYGDQNIARYLLENIHPEIFHGVIHFCRRWSNWQKEDLLPLLDNLQLKDYRSEMMELILLQENTDFQSWQKQQIHEYLQKLDCAEDKEFLKVWFQISESRWAEALYLILLERMKRSSTLIGIDFNSMVRLKTRLIKLAALCFQYSLPHRQDSLFSPYHSLVHRLFAQQFRQCRDWILLLTLLPRGNAQTRELIYEILHNNEQEQQVLLLLEILDNLLGKKERKILAILLEPMGSQLRRHRLKPLAMNLEFQPLLELWNLSVSESDSISSKLFIMSPISYLFAKKLN